MKYIYCAHNISKDFHRCIFLGHIVSCPHSRKRCCICSKSLFHLYHTRRVVYIRFHLHIDHQWYMLLSLCIRSRICIYRFLIYQCFPLHCTASLMGSHCSLHKYWQNYMFYHLYIRNLFNMKNSLRYDMDEEGYRSPLLQSTNHQNYKFSFPCIHCW